MNKLLKEAEKYTIYVTIFLVPLVFLSSFFNPFLTPKLIVLVVGVAIALVFRLLRIASTGTFEYHQGPFDFPVFLLMLVYILSGIYATPNRYEAFFLPGNATLIVASALLYFMVNQLEAENKNRVIYVLIGSGFVSSLIYLISLTGVLSGIGSLPLFMKSRNFSTQGALLPTAIFLLILIPYCVGQIFKSKDYLQKVVLGCGTAIIGITLLIASFNMITDRENFKLASFDASLSVTFDALKGASILGVGPSNFVTAYTRFRPISTNQGDDWTARYSHARNFYLTAITETGFAGAFALILIVLVLAKMVNSEIKSRELRTGVALMDYKTIAVALLFIVLLLFPATSPEIIVLMFLSLAFVSTTKKFKLGVAGLSQFGDTKSSKLPSIIMVTPFIVAIIYLFVVGTRVVAAERIYKVALDHLAKNEGTQAYESLQSAINTNPGIDRYHATYSQINFLLAEAVARKENLSDSDKQTITQLIQQSIREAKNTVALNPFRASNWQILGETYRNVMPLATGADQFAIQSYGQAVLLDPVNPDLRIALGGIWYSVKNYENAIDSFKLAVVSKPDHANARYNLAIAYRDNGSIDRAIAELKTVLSLVKPDTKDYETASAELKSLEEKKASATPTNGETLKSPTTNQPAIENPIALPESAGPEDVIPSPSASPSVSPKASPSPTATVTP